MSYTYVQQVANSLLRTIFKIGNWNIRYYRFNKFGTGTSNCYRSRRLATGTSTWLLKEALRMSPSCKLLLLFTEYPDVWNQKRWNLFKIYYSGNPNTGHPKSRFIWTPNFCVQNLNGKKMRGWLCMNATDHPWSSDTQWLHFSWSPIHYPTIILAW